MILEFKNSTIHYTIDGSGPAIVLLHGFLENLSMWDSMKHNFTSTHQVICIDLLGHGKTDSLGYIHTMEQMADTVLAVLAHHKVKKAQVIGHSMGGYVALAMAEKHPTLFKGLCLMNSTFEADDKERKLIRERANKMAQTNFENLVRLSFANLFAPKSRELYKKDYEVALEQALQTSLQGYMAAQEGMKIRPQRLEAFKAIKGKKLIITGEKDSLINTEALNAKIDATPIKLVELSEGHMSYIENISELSYLLKQFIEK